MSLDKALDAFRTISEVAEDLDLPQHVLRFWETRFNQIKPLKRGGGRRYYRPDDVELVKGIKHLLYAEGYTIKGVQRILKEEGLKFVQNIWRDGAQDVQAAAPASVAQIAPVVAPQDRHMVSIQISDTERAAEHLRRAESALSSVAILKPEDCDKLNAALQTLAECRRILSQTLSETIENKEAA